MRFSLQALFLAFVLIWSSLAAFAWHGIWVAGLLLALVAFIRAAESPGERLGQLAGCLACGCVLWLLLNCPGISGGPSPQGECFMNITHLTLAFRDYHTIHGSFPPAYTTDAEGKPMHSWRVLILPYLGRNDLYKRYDFNQPWDSPKNQRLATSMPDEFRCPSDPAADSNCTNYVAVVGRDTAWPGSTPRKLTDFGDDAQKTILLVEIADSDINWLEPRDLTFEEARTGVHAPGEPGISSYHTEDKRYFYHDDHAAHVGLVDTAVEFLPTRTPPKTLEMLLTVGGPKPIDLAPPDQGERLRWDRIVALLTMAITFLLLVFRPKRSGE